MAVPAPPARTSATAPVLLVEDTPSLQLVYRSVLTSAGYGVRIAATAWRFA